MAKVLGIDIGGTKTHAVLSDAPGATLAEHRCASASLQSVGPQEAALALDDLLARLGAHAGDVEVVVAGSAGLDTPAVEERLTALLAERFPRARITGIHDARLLLAAGREKAGCAFIFGTGSCAWALAPDGRTARAGGWGWAIGDESSGFGMVRAALRLALIDWQAGLPPTLLTEYLCTAAGVTGPDGLLDAFYSHPNSGFWARHTSAVLEAYHASAPTAVAVVDETVDHAAGEIVAACGQVGITGPVILGGGVAMNVPTVSSLLTARLEAAGLTDVRVLGRDPVWGAVDMAHEQLR